MPTRKPKYVFYETHDDYSMRVFFNKTELREHMAELLDCYTCRVESDTDMEEHEKDLRLVAKDFRVHEVGKRVDGSIVPKIVEEELKWAEQEYERCLEEEEAREARIAEHEAHLVEREYTASLLDLELKAAKKGYRLVPVEDGE